MGTNREECRTNGEEWRTNREHGGQAESNGDKQRGMEDNWRGIGTNREEWKTSGEQWGQTERNGGQVERNGDKQRGIEDKRRGMGDKQRGMTERENKVYWQEGKNEEKKKLRSVRVACKETEVQTYITRWRPRSDSPMTFHQNSAIKMSVDVIYLKEEERMKTKMKGDSKNEEKATSVRSIHNKKRRHHRKRCLSVAYRQRTMHVYTEIDGHPSLSLMLSPRTYQS